MILTENGVLKLMQRIKSFIASQLNTKANSVHTHTISEIDDLSSLQMGGGYSKSEVDTLLNGKSDTSHTHTVSDVTDFPTLATVATSGDYDDLTNKPTIPIVDSALSSTSTNALQNKAINTELSKKANTSHTHTVSDVTDFPTLATVATSGSYNDLSNKPTTMTPTSHTHGNITNDGKIGSNANKPLITTTGGTVTTGSFGTSANTFCEGNDSRLSDARTPTSHTHVKSEITDFPSLATVATSGSYNDLSNKPTIPTVNNATLTIQKNGTTVKTFTANASSNVTANITVPTKVSELDNDSNYLTSVPNLDASKITSGTIDIARLPAGALERLVTVTNRTARFALTTSSVQLGDVVKQTDTGVMYYVVDTANLNSEDGYSEFTAGTATSVPWSGVTGKPSSYTPSSHTHGNISNAGAIGTTANKPLITTTNGVITTGSFGTTANTFCQGNDSRLSDARTPTAHTHSASDITSGLATVATSGSYNDLSNKPTIPTVNNATLTIQKNGTTVKTFTANASSNVTANITVPTKTSDLTNDSHVSITTETDTTSTGTPAHGGTFTCIDSVTRDSNGHVTKVNTKTVTLPSDSNTDTLVTQNVSTANENHPILLSATKDATTNQGAKTSIFASGVKVNPSTGTVTATAFSGNLTGNVTGNVSGSSGSCTGNSATATKATNNANGKELTNTIIKGLSISGKTITYTQIDGNTGTLTTQDNNTDTKVTQAYSTTNNSYPVLSSATAGITSTNSRGATTAIVNNGIYTNPSTGALYATKLYSNGTEVLTSHQSLANYSTLANTVKSISISGKTITVTPGSGSAYTLTTQDTTYSNFVKSGSGAKAGLVPAPSTTAGTTKYLREDGTWQVPPDHTYNVYNKTLTIQKNGTNVATFTSNSNTDVTANISVPTKTSDLTNDSGFLTSHQDLSGYVPRSGGTVLSGSAFSRTVNNDELQINGGTGWGQGASIALGGKDKTGNTGTIYLHADDSTSYNQLEVWPNGVITRNVNGSVKNLAIAEDVIPRSGGTVLNGRTFSRTVDNDFLAINGSSTDVNGAFLRLHGKDYSDTPYAGTIFIRAQDGTNASNLLLKPDGTANWAGKNLAMKEDVIPRSGGSVLTGLSLSKTDDTRFFELNGGSGWHHGAGISLRGKDCNTYGDNGCFLVQASDGTNEKLLTGNPNGTLTWNGQSIQTTSDQRLKQQITQIDNALLDAWEDVEPVQFKYNDAVNEKGDNARLHTGYVVQQIDEACKSHNLDISAYGLYCHEEHPEETEEVEVEQEDGTKIKERKVIREASEHYSLRYTETLVVECAYLRRENTRLNDRLTVLEELFKQYIAK